MASPDNWQSQHEGRLAAMIEVAQAAGAHTLKHFRSSELVVDAKKDDSPVTVADREAEQLVRTMLAERFPNDTLQGEEFEEQVGSSSYRWIVDPIDGTKSFVCGVPLYSTLLAVEHNGESLGGVIFIPALGEIIAAVVGEGAWYRNGARADWTQASVSGKTDIAEAVFVTSEVGSFDERGTPEAYKRIESDAWVTRSWGDGYGYLLVATGRAEIMIDPICNAWDVAAIAPVIEEAGGKFSDWNGTPTTRGGDGVGTNGHLHQAVLDRLGL